MTPFRAALDWERIDDATWRGALDDTWSQGRATFGGIQAAIALRCLQHLVDDDRPPRTLTVSFVGPLPPGEATFTGRVERAGGSVTAASGRLEHAGGTAAVVLAAFGRPREHWLRRTGEGPPAYRDPRSVVWPEAKHVPSFTRYFHMDLVRGMPFSGADEPAVGGWIRFTDPEPADAVALAALGDVWPPAAIACMDRPRPSSSVDLTYDFLQPPPLDVRDHAWFSFQAETTVAGEGYAEERGSLWDEHGRLALRIRQLRAVY